jgi:hypothetical protein
MDQASTLELEVENERITYPAGYEYLERLCGSYLPFALPKLLNLQWELIVTRPLHGVGHTMTLYVLQKRWSFKPDIRTTDG